MSHRTQIQTLAAHAAGRVRGLRTMLAGNPAATDLLAITGATSESVVAAINDLTDGLAATPLDRRVARGVAVYDSALPVWDSILLGSTISATAVVPSTASFFESIIRARFQTNATTNSNTALRTLTAFFYLSSTPDDLGGFDLRIRFGPSLMSPASKWFIGFREGAASISSATLISALQGIIGLGAEAGDANLSIFHNNLPGSATKINLGPSWPNTAGTYFYEFRLVNEPGAGQDVYWSLRRLNDDQFIDGRVVSTELPTPQTYLAFHMYTATGALADPVAIDFASLYVEHERLP